MRVFISSTSYDLIDLRAELEAFFREAGVTPVLSDSPTSEFEVQTSENSIETCLANVRSCEAFVIVLSNRYGPSLAKAGFDDVSATHLEYREAAQSGKSVHMYVRDRLEAEYSIWRKNEGNKELSWCKNPDDWQVFSLLEEHRKLQNEQPQNNWIWTFRNSIELKQRIAIDFSRTLGSYLHNRHWVALAWAHMPVSVLGLTRAVTTLSLAWVAERPDAYLTKNTCRQASGRAETVRTIQIEALLE